MKTEMIPFCKAVKKLQIGKFAIINNPEKNILNETLNLAISNNLFEKTPVYDLTEFNNFVFKEMKHNMVEDNYRNIIKINTDMQNHILNMVI